MIKCLSTDGTDKPFHNINNILFLCVLLHKRGKRFRVHPQGQLVVLSHLPAAQINELIHGAAGGGEDRQGVSEASLKRA